MTPKSEIEKIAKGISHPNYNYDTIELFKTFLIDGFKFAEWLQIGWIYTGTGWVKGMLPELNQKEKSIEELFKLFLKE